MDGPATNLIFDKQSKSYKYVDSPALVGRYNMATTNCLVNVGEIILLAVTVLELDI